VCHFHPLDLRNFHPPLTPSASLEMQAIEAEDLAAASM